MSTLFLIGQSGFLDMKDAPDKRVFFDFGDHDPARIKNNLKINKLAEELFPYVLTGVRFWPFLLVARDLEEKNVKRPSENKVIKKLQEIATIQRKNPNIGPHIRLGPRTLNSFRPYQGMLRLIREKSSKRENGAQILEKFLLNKKYSYKGKLEFFKKYEKKWKKILYKSLGKPGKEFAKLINNNKFNNLWDAIEEILTKPRKFHPKLVEGASAYTLLFCLYGIVEEGQVYHDEDSKKRASFLLKLIDKRSSLPVANYYKFIRQAVNSSKPPFAKISKKAKKQGRRILAGLRFSTFWNLYRRPSPRVLE